MPSERFKETLGPPSFKVDTFQLWIHGRQFPDSTDLWDGNWLNVTAHCGDDGASVWVSGAILTTMDLERFTTECGRLYRKEASEASLAPLEPNLRITLVPFDRLGHIKMSVHITPDHMSQRHEFTFGLDQTFLPGISMQLFRVLEGYPVRK
jgi:hypothetical protein